MSKLSYEQKEQYVELIENEVKLPVKWKTKIILE